MPIVCDNTKIALVDCNNFYVSCERLFNQKLRNRPVIVLSNNDSNVIARSQEAKNLGIKMGVPLFQIRDLIFKHDVLMFSSNYELYGDLSSRVMNVLSQFTPHLEEYSIDEAFLELPNDPQIDYSLMANKIKQRVQQNVGIPVTVGIGQTKVLSKVAVEFAKKDNSYNGVLEGVWKFGERLGKV